MQRGPTTGLHARTQGSWPPAIARVCQEAAVQVACNVRLAETNIDVPVSDDRRIEVVANALPLRHSSQPTVDATIVSPVTWAGEPQPGADACRGCPSQETPYVPRACARPSLPLGGRWRRGRRPIQRRSRHVANVATIARRFAWVARVRLTSWRTPWSVLFPTPLEDALLRLLRPGSLGSDGSGPRGYPKPVPDRPPSLRSLAAGPKAASTNRAPLAVAYARWGAL